MLEAFRRVSSVWGKRSGTSGKESDNEAPSYFISTHGKEVQLTPKSSSKAVRPSGTDNTTNNHNNKANRVLGKDDSNHDNNKANRVLGKDLDDALGQDQAKAKAVRDHDMFNLYFLGVIVMLNYYLLYHSTEWSKLGTPELGVEYRPLARVLLGLLTLYLVRERKTNTQHYHYLNLTPTFPYSTHIKSFHISRYSTQYGS